MEPTRAIVVREILYLPKMFFYFLIFLLGILFKNGLFWHTVAFRPKKFIVCFSANYLSDFELIGNYKLVDSVNEIWTHVPHVQGVCIV